MKLEKVSFSISDYAAWAPGLDTQEAWLAWAKNPCAVGMDSEPGVRAMPAMLRRRAGFLGKMALEAAYQCIGAHKNIPTVFCSRHGEVSRSLEMLSAMAEGEPLSPTSFGMSVHNAIGGLFSIARADKSNNMAIAAGSNSVENAVIEACGLLEDGAPRVLLVVYDCPLPPAYVSFQGSDNQAYSWAWLMERPGEDVVSLSWSGSAGIDLQHADAIPAGLEIHRFYLLGEQKLEKTSGRQRWCWSRNA
jgi:hypothetical protein